MESRDFLEESIQLNIQVLVYWHHQFWVSSLDIYQCGPCQLLSFPKNDPQIAARLLQMRQ